jgi:hypothetical protein
VPFKGRLEGVVTTTPVQPPQPPLMSVEVEGTGNATHLGRFTWVATLVANNATGKAAGSYQFPAANGDVLFTHFVGLGKPTETPGVLSIVDDVTITGGTGRFAGATGTFNFKHLYDITAGTTFGSIDGTIASTGAAKRSIASTGAAKRSKR